MELREIKRRVDLHALAGMMGLERPDPKGNYRSPHHDDKSPSLSIFTGNDGDVRWKDFSNNEGGDCFDLVKYVRGCDDASAISEIRTLFNFPYEKIDSPVKRERTTLDFISDKCLQAAERAHDYLTNKRGLKAEVINEAIKRKTLGFNDYTNPRRQSGEVGYGGEAVAFICLDRITREVRGVDFRYLDPVINGDCKTQSKGEKDGVLWASCWAQVKAAHTVVLVESAINALSLESAWFELNKKGFAAIALRGTMNADLNWKFLAGKLVMLSFDNDEPQKDGRKPGLELARKVSDSLTAQNIASGITDHNTEGWKAIGDINDLYLAQGAQSTHLAVLRREEWLIPGQSAIVGSGRDRVFLPAHDFSQYFKFRVRDDFTRLAAIKTDESGTETVAYEDLCGFRVAALSRISVASANATMSGVEDAQPNTVFAASVQVPRHGKNLLRRVVSDDGLYNLTNWNKFGPIFKPQQFNRMLSIWERATELGARNAANFVGLCYRNQKPALNEGHDCYFSNPEQQCPYHNITFPSATVADGQRVLNAFIKTMRSNAASTLLVWAVGCHLKALLGFWPHMVLQAGKGSGKTTIIKALEQAISFTMFSGQSLATEFRLVTSVSHTSHPVGWEELSARRQDVIDKAVALLQETYQFSVTRRGADMTEYLLSAPVLLAGEDVPVDSLQGKLVRTDLTGRKGELVPENLPSFPVREWILFLAEQEPSRVRELHRNVRDRLIAQSAANKDDDGAMRIINNYAAIGTAWRLLASFLGIAVEHENFAKDLVAEMNAHIMETRASREPWVWIMEIIFSEIDRGQFDYPHKIDLEDGQPCLYIRPTHIMAHIAHSPALRNKFDSLPVKTAKVLTTQLQRANTVIREGIEKTIRNQRVGHLYALDLEVLASYGLSVSMPSDVHVFNQGNTVH